MHLLALRLASVHLKPLSIIISFLVAITSACRASELAALRADAPHIQFYPDKVVLYPDVSFLPKVISDFHVNQPLILPTLFPSPFSDIERMLHSLDVCRTLAFYISRTKDFRTSPRLFVCFHGPHKGFSCLFTDGLKMDCLCHYVGLSISR